MAAPSPSPASPRLSNIATDLAQPGFSLVPFGDADALEAAIVPWTI